jgi:hypothetical protein
MLLMAVSLVPMPILARDGQEVEKSSYRLDLPNVIHTVRSDFSGNRYIKKIR